jgi:adenosylcobinamide-phosphate synthase
VALLSLVLSLLIERFRPLGPGRFPFDAFLRYGDVVARNFNGGQQRHGMLAWLVAVGPWILLAEIGFYVCSSLGFVFGLAWSVGVLYLTMGTHRVSDGFARIHDALRERRLDDARQRVGLWSEGPADDYTESEVAKVAIEQGILRAHQHVFGVVAWYVFIPAVLGTLLPGGLGLLLSGPGGAVLYRLSTLLDERWGRTNDDAFRAFGQFARTTAQWLEWVPTRLTALSFAIVGDFEDAVYCWRSQAAAWTDRQIGILLASGAGALGVRLGEALHGAGRVILRPEIGLGDEADAEHLDSAVGLIWRALVLWMLVIALVTLASEVSSLISLASRP